MNAEERAKGFLFGRLFGEDRRRGLIALTSIIEEAEQAAIQHTRKSIRDALLEYANAHSIAEHVALIEECAEIAMMAKPK